MARMGYQPTLAEHGLGSGGAAGRALQERRLVCRDVVHRAAAQALTHTDGVSAMMRSSVRRPIRLIAGLLAM